ncbi:MAG: STAS domain-containing protein [Phycisphaerales bacterium]|jgi:anti-anti-sigma factor
MSSPLPDRHATSLVEITRREGVLLVKPAGPSIGQREAPIIEQEVLPYLEEMGKSLDHLVVDLSAVTFMSSMGLGMCISFRNKAAASKSDSILFGVCKELLGLLSMMKIEKLYKIAKDQTHLDKLLK